MTQDAPLTFAQSPLSGLPSITQVVVVILFVSILIYVTLKYLNSRGLLKPLGLKKKMMQVVERLYLGPNRSLFIVRVGEKLHLIGVTDHSINLLSNLNEGYEAQENPMPAQQKESPAI